VYCRLIAAKSVKSTLSNSRRCLIKASFPATCNATPLQDKLTLRKCACNAPLATFLAKNDSVASCRKSTLVLYLLAYYLSALWCGACDSKNGMHAIGGFWCLRSITEIRNCCPLISCNLKPNYLRDSC